MRKNKAVPQKQFSILTVDDDPLMTSTIQSYFQRNGYSVDTENDPEQAIMKIRNGSYDILLLDFLMTPICGDQVIKEVRSFNKEIFIILLTGHKSMAPPIKSIREMDIQGYYEKSDRFDQLELLVESCVKSIKQMRTIKDLHDQMEKAYLETIMTLRFVVETKDLNTRGHSDRVSKLASLLAQKMGCNDNQIEKIRVAGMFHDVGKIGVPDNILQKEGNLTKDEYEKIKEHPLTGAKIISGISRFQDFIPIVINHHERIDGTGYPNGLKGDEIPFEARIISVVDAFDAMVSVRSYKEGMTLEYAINEIRNGAGTQFDSDVVNCFITLLESVDNYDDFLAELESEEER